ncbi:chemotaxis protein CheB [Saccharothrix yanglingensis]|uniref:protein-glutamate methylesterase n=1 Tax=Saccharothrix yanglingensis TaxID=659496 RepID=A0ABU0WWC4_9PSEU|nr:chemotaxis protein CheB [Saccharothrix yanglingensis]MDQ2584169.1 hypothetical protein [Saccharothrix yanglingensis]
MDALFRSAAATHGAGTIGVVLSGTLDDGTAGMISIVNRGGLALVQDPEEALFDGMPASVLRNTHVDHVLSVAKMGALLRECVGQEVRRGDEPPDLARRETAVASSGVATHADEVVSMGHPSNFSGPDCQGNLVEPDVVPKRFRCQVGHAWTAEALLDAQGVTLEKALRTALRTLGAKAGLARRMRQDAVERGAELLVRRYQRTEANAEAGP